MTSPIISVVMSVYNAERYLRESIESILTQTFQDFEFIIIDDGSTDRSLEIIEQFSKQDQRIVVVSRENRGLVSSLNEGIEKARGRYIARMDADDISLPLRFEKQIEMMEKEGVDLCGSHFYIIDENSKYISARVVSTNPEFMKVVLARAVPFSHGSVMIRKGFLDKYGLRYGQTEYIKAEDYALWVSCLENKGKISNVDDFLFKYRHMQGSQSKQSSNLKHALMLSAQYIDKNYSDVLGFIFDNYQHPDSIMKSFEEEQLSYFLIKTIFRGRFYHKYRLLKQLSINNNVINVLRVLASR